MRYLLDASALLPLVTKQGRNLLARASREWFAVTDLAVYEGCNAVWKMSHLLHSISVEDGMETVSVIGELVERGILHFLSVSELELAATLELAIQRGLTYYDASYVMVAEHQGAVLVTQDRALAESAHDRVEILSVEDLERKLS
jgi:predicted nucleic acid-binding protein